MEAETFRCEVHTPKSTAKGLRGKGVGRPRKAKRTGPPLPGVTTVPPTAQVADWLQQQQAQPQWQQRALVAEGDVLQLRGKLQGAQRDAQRARDAVKAAEIERDQLRARVKELEACRSKGPVQQLQQQQPKQGVGTEGGRGRPSTIHMVALYGHHIFRHTICKMATGYGWRQLVPSTSDATLHNPNPELITGI